MKKFEEIGNILNDVFSELDEYMLKRENVLRETRDILGLCREVINLTHLRRLEELVDVVNRLNNGVSALLSKIKNEPKLYYSGSLRDILKEYVEAILLYDFITKFHKGENWKMIKPRELGVPPEAFLMGVMDFLGELKREVVYYIRERDFNSAWQIFEYMTFIFSQLDKKILLNAVIPGYKSRIDSLKRMIVSTEEFILKIENENRIIDKLSNLE